MQIIVYTEKAKTNRCILMGMFFCSLKFCLPCLQSRRISGNQNRFGANRKFSMENIPETFGRILTIFTASQMTRCSNATCTLLTISHKSVCDGDDIHLFLLTSSVMCAFFSVRVTPFSSLSFPHRLNTR